MAVKTAQLWTMAVKTEQLGVELKLERVKQLRVKKEEQ